MPKPRQLNFACFELYKNAIILYVFSVFLLLATVIFVCTSVLCVGLGHLFSLLSGIPLNSLQSIVLPEIDTWVVSRSWLL